MSGQFRTVMTMLLFVHLALLALGAWLVHQHEHAAVACGMFNLVVNAIFGAQCQTDLQRHGPR
jgi:hypothetical protein